MTPTKAQQKMKNDANAAGERQMQGLDVPARLIPIPATISAEAQAFLSRGMPIAPATISHTDKAAWRAYIAQAEAMMGPALAARGAAAPASIDEHLLSNATLYEITPDSLTAEEADTAILHTHGGGFVFGGGRLAAYAAIPLCVATGLRSFSVDYRMPPDHAFPAGLDDALEAYRFLLERFAPAKIAFEGSSAGANLAAALALRARDEGLPLPGACVLHTAGVDISESGDTFATNSVVDVVLRRTNPDMMRLYAGDRDLRHPYLSPVFADLSKGFPPSILLSGTRDMLLSPTVMMHRALRRAGIEAELHVFEAMPHGGFGHGSPEDRELLAECARFVRSHLVGYQAQDLIGLRD